MRQTDPKLTPGIAYLAYGERWRLPDADAKSRNDRFARLTVSLVALLYLNACVRCPWLRIPSLFQDHSNVLFPNLEPCSKGSGHLNNSIYDFG